MEQIELKANIEPELDSRTRDSVDKITKFAVFSEIVRSARDKDPIAGEAIAASIRRLINAGISLGDAAPLIGGILGSVIPGAGTLVGAGLGHTGEVASWASDLYKMLRPVVKATIGINMPDLTPDVSMKQAIGTELLDTPFGGILPSHYLFEYRPQVAADKPRVQKAINEAKDRIRAKRQPSNTTKEAIGVFNVTISPSSDTKHE